MIIDNLFQRLKPLVSVNQSKIEKLKILSKIDMEDIVNNLYEKNYIEIIDPVERLIDNFKKGCLYIGKEINKSNFFIEITLLGDFIKNDEDSSSFWKIFILPKSSIQDNPDELKESLLPILGMFACFFNVWGEDKINIFPYFPEKIFYKYDFENFYFVAVSILSSVSITEIQENYRINNFLLLSGEYIEKSNIISGLWEKKINFSELCSPEGFWKGKIEDLAWKYSVSVDDIMNELKNHADKNKRLEIEGQVYYGSSIIFFIKENIITIYSPEYFSNVAES